MNPGLTLMKHAVLQRNNHNLSEHPFSGTCRASGQVFCHAESVAGFEHRLIGSAKSGQFKAVIGGLPAGGPYKVELTIESGTGKILERCTVEDVLVGDLWILAGQSNMQGCGYMPGLVPENPMLRNFYMDDRWDISAEPLHNLGQAAAPVHGGNPNLKPKRPILRGVGPGMSFAQVMYEATGVPQGTIACAHGGTSMDQWSPALLKEGGNSLYGAMFQRVRNLGGKVSGMVWYQGCNDANPNGCSCYEEKFRNFIHAVRKDLKQPALPIVFAQLASYLTNIGNDHAWTVVRDAQYRIGNTEKNCQCTATLDLELDDCIHLSAASQKILGKRMASAMLYLLGKGGSPAIQVQKIKMTPDKATGNANVEVTFRNVQGELTAPGLASGFCTINRMTGAPVCCFKAELKGNKVIAHTNVSAMFGENYFLGYGIGTKPYGNIADKAGRALPAFIFPQPLRVLQPNETSMVTQAQVSDPVYGEESLESLSMPENPDSLTWQDAVNSEFYIVHPRRTELASTRTKVFYFRFKMELKEPLPLTIHAGADAPFALFCDGKECMRHFTINPLIIDQFTGKIKLEAGIHQWVFAFSSNTGHGWGVCCRFTADKGKTAPVLLPW